MNFDEMTIDALKKHLDSVGVDYSDAKVKNDFLTLAKANAAQDEHQEPETTEEKPSGVAALVKSAIKVEKKTVKVADDPFAYLKDRDYSMLSVGERAIIRDQSPEYENVSEGVKVTVTDRLTTKHRIVRLPDRSFAKLVKGATYTMDQADFDKLKGEKVKVKTIATQNRCCGGAKYEDIALIEVVA